MTSLENAIFDIQNDADFLRVALDVYHFQRIHVPVYKQFVERLNRPAPTQLEEIPFLPISFFKSTEIRAGLNPVEVVFKSSGTTGTIRSQHFVESTAMYERSFFATYVNQIGNPADQIILALLPNYIEQGNSSLVYMVDALIQATHNPISGFYLNDLATLVTAYQQALASGKKVVIFGVSYALLDLAELAPNLDKATIIETGGMKGRRKELTKEELHATLKAAFQVPYISSEYGMTELLSQAYSDAGGLFEMPAWMRVKIRDTNDPFAYLDSEKTGGINVIDLANLYSCSFISTQDLGKITGPNKQLQLMGRFDNSDIRGCNLMVE